MYDDRYSTTNFTGSRSYSFTVWTSNGTNDGGTTTEIWDYRWRQYSQNYWTSNSVDIPYATEATPEEKRRRLNLARTRAAIVLMRRLLPRRIAKIEPPLPTPRRGRVASMSERWRVTA